MPQWIHYVGRYQDVTGRYRGLPSWGRLVVFVAAIPGIALGILSLVALAISIAALLVLAAPAYRLVALISGSTGGGFGGGMTVASAEPSESESFGRRQVDAKVIE
jgi:hypothetical protein